MENEIMKDIVNYAVNKLKDNYGYCGLAQSSNMAMLNSDDGDGNDIKINIRVVPEED